MEIEPLTIGLMQTIDHESITISCVNIHTRKSHSKKEKNKLLSFLQSYAVVVVVFACEPDTDLKHK